MTRFKAMVVNRTDRSRTDELLPFYALEQIEPGFGRLLSDAQVEEKTDGTAIQHRPGDVRFGKLRPYLAKSLLMSDHGHGSGELLVLRPRSAAVDGCFLHYLTLSKGFLEWATATAYGVKMPRTSWTALGDFDVQPPGPEVQRRVVAYLDAEVSKIDGLMNEQLQLLTYSEERLDASRRSQLLGPDGMGDPSWDRARLKRFVTTARGRFTHRPRNDPALYDGPYPFIQTGDIARAPGGVVRDWTQTLNERGLAASRLAPAGTVVMAIAANIGDVATLGFDACFPDSVVALTPRPGLRSDYLIELVRALKQDLVGSSTLNTQLNINVDRIGDIVVPVPPEADQARLVQRLREEEQRLLEISTEVDAQVALLQEHRQALITHAITQGIDGLPGVA